MIVEGTEGIVKFIYERGGEGVEGFGTVKRYCWVFINLCYIEIEERGLPCPTPGRGSVV